MDLICIGEMLIDFLPGDETGIYIRKAGGAPANVAVAAARNGLDVGFCGTMGNDDFGKFLTNTLEENRIRVLCPKLLDEAVTTMAFVSLDETGNRSFTFARKPGADMFLTRDHIDRAHLTDTRAIHAGSLSLSKEPAADATVLCHALWPGPWGNWSVLMSTTGTSSGITIGRRPLPLSGRYYLWWIY